MTKEERNGALGHFTGMGWLYLLLRRMNNCRCKTVLPDPLHVMMKHFNTTSLTGHNNLNNRMIS